MSGLIVKQPQMLNHHTSIRSVINAPKQSSVLTLTYLLQVEIPLAFLDQAWNGHRWGGTW